MSCPDIGYKLFFKVGGLIFTSIGPLVVCELGLFPLKVVLGFARKGTDDGPDDKFEKAREFFGNLVEGWNLGELAQQTEDNNTYQEQDKKI